MFSTLNALVRKVEYCFKFEMKLSFDAELTEFCPTPFLPFLFVSMPKKFDREIFTDLRELKLSKKSQIC